MRTLLLLRGNMSATRCTQHSLTDKKDPMADLPEKLAQGTPTAASVRAEVEQKEVREVAYSGPLPPPEMLNQFDPETRAAIVADFTAHSEYRREISHQALASTVDLARRAKTG